MTILPFSNFHVHTDEQNCKWIVSYADGEPYMDATALAWVCGVTHSEISNVANQTAKCPNPMRGIDLSNVVKIENPNKGKPLFGIPKEVCTQIHKYYAFDARGNEKRQRSKDLYHQMFLAGFAVFVYRMAGYEVKPKLKISNEPTSEQSKQYELNQQRLVFVNRLLNRMTLKVQFVDLFDFVKTWKLEHQDFFYDFERDCFKDKKYETYVPSIVNTTYAKVLGNNKKKICKLKDIPYNDSTIRDYLPPEAMEALLAVEAYMRQLVVVFGIEPMLALNKAMEMMAVDLRWGKVKFPLTWEKDICITCPPAMTEQAFRNRYLEEKARLEISIRDYLQAFVFKVSEPPVLRSQE